MMRSRQLRPVRNALGLLLLAATACAGLATQDAQVIELTMATEGKPLRLDYVHEIMLTVRATDDAAPSGWRDKNFRVFVPHDGDLESIVDMIVQAIRRGTRTGAATEATPVTVADDGALRATIRLPEDVRLTAMRIWCAAGPDAAELDADWSPGVRGRTRAEFVVDRP